MKTKGRPTERQRAVRALVSALMEKIEAEISRATRERMAAIVKELK